MRPSTAALVSIGEGRFYSNGLDVELLTAGPDIAGPYLDRVLGLLHRVLVLPVATVADMFNTALRLARSRGGKDRGALGTIKADLYRAVTTP